MPFDQSPLFSEASQAIRDAATRNFARSDFGQLIRKLESAALHPQAEQRVAGMLRQWKTLASPERAVRQIMGSDFASIVRTVERYAKGSGGGGIGKRVVLEFLKSLGVAGNLIRSLAFSDKAPSGYRSSLNDAMSLIRAFGGEVVPGKNWGTVGDVERAAAAMQERLASIKTDVKRLPKMPEPEPRRPEMGGSSPR